MKPTHQHSSQPISELGPFGPLIRRILSRRECLAFITFYNTLDSGVTAEQLQLSPGICWQDLLESMEKGAFIRKLKVITCAMAGNRMD